MPGKIMIVRHEAHTGLSATYSAATLLGAAVKVTGVKTIGPVASASDVSVGVSHHEKTAAQITAGDNRGTFRLKGDVIPMIASAAITAGDAVELAAAGKVAKKASGATYGVAWTSASGADAEVLVIVL